MPKKAVRKPHASDIRRGNKTQADLRQGIAEIRQTAAALDAIVRRMEQAEIAELKLDGVTKLDRGVALLREFNLRARIGLIQAEAEAGLDLDD